MKNLLKIAIGLSVLVVVLAVFSGVVLATIKYTAILVWTVVAILAAYVAWHIGDEILKAWRSLHDQSTRTD